MVGGKVVGGKVGGAVRSCGGRVVWRGGVVAWWSRIAAPDIILGLTGPNAKPQASPHADAGYESRAFRHIPPCVPGDLAQKLATGPYGVIRAKGFLRDCEGASWVIQTVGQRFEAQRSQKLDPAGLVCIGRRGALDTAALEALLGLAG